MQGWIEQALREGRDARCEMHRGTEAYGRAEGVEVFSFIRYYPVACVNAYTAYRKEVFTSWNNIDFEVMANFQRSQ